jgi:threonine aldolase
MMPFASDNWSGVTPEVAAALGRANAGHAPAYGDDALTATVVERFSEVFERRVRVHFVTSGTAANVLCLQAVGRPGGLVLCTEQAHLHADEYNGPEYFTGMKTVPIPTADARLTPASLTERLSRLLPASQRGPVAALSLTNATEHGTVYSAAEVTELAAIARAHGAAVHVDGARFANAVASLGCEPADISWRAGVDVLSLGGTKNGLPFGEAVVFFDRTLAQEFGRRRMQGGQLASKMRYLAAPWLGVLRNGAWLRYAMHANAMARRLADAVADVPGTRLLAPVEANGVFLDLPLSMIEALRARDWKFYEFIGATGIRLMCSWDTTPEVVDALAADIRALANEKGKAA